jgi:hypothetical protein
MQAEHKFVVEVRAFGKKILHKSRKFTIDKNLLFLVFLIFILLFLQLVILISALISEKGEDTLLCPIGSKRTVLYLNFFRHDDRATRYTEEIDEMTQERRAR